ncbi:ribosomal protein S1 [Thermodesulfatator indicus DSM 15286]|uniref:Small ribosomal subunit protein bS1 n=1 Tax=Thermodesulfatator indicus (strain DSM 15286 / JCM 11887 / CIR29812) TaxID=667014 RepID=F8A8Y3_THEID|nr:30S ribosomal protein S1 [Thermodesulfatator indicus]AEH44030.1 ribosomal protein S1 [Thermodesulfatator indicus DSM 15286]
MENVIENQNQAPEESFEELLAGEIKTISRGEVLTGKVLRVDPEWVFIDIGYKSEGVAPTTEFTGPNGEVKVKPGDEVEILIENLRTPDGMVRVAYKKLQRRRAWNKIEQAQKNKTPLEAYVLERIKGGFAVDIEGLKAFLPFSQAFLKPPKNPEEIIGTTLKVEVVSVDRKKNNVVVSHRNYLEKESERRKKELLENLEEGQVLEGTVKSITDYGVFVDLGGVDGLLHVSDISWGRVKHPSNYFKVGDKIKVKVIKYDREKEKIALGIKQLTPDPWETVAEKYPEGKRIEGKVVSLTNFGAFVELEPGVEGLIHISELSWTKRIKHPRDILEVGDKVEVVVLGVDSENRRVSLSLKQVEPNPWDVLVEQFSEGMVIEAPVKTVTDFGVFVEVMEGIDGFIHVSDLSWGRIKHPSEAYKPGDMIQAVILKIDREKEKLALGVKQLTPDPWESVPEKYPVGSVVTGKVSNVTDFGVFVELEEGVEGLVHVSEISDKKVKTPVGMFEPGQEVKAKVVKIEPESRRIGLSIKKLKEDEEKKEYQEFSKGSQKGSITLGAILKETLNSGKTK